MNTLKNSVNLIGNLGKDGTINTFDSGTKKASVSIATTEYFKNNKGELQKETQWHNLIAWGRNAELMAKALQKGNQIAVRGSISSRNYEDKSGVTRNITEIVVNEFMKIHASAPDSDKSSVSKGKKAINKETAEPLPF